LGFITDSRWAIEQLAPQVPATRKTVWSINEILCKGDVKPASSINKPKAHLKGCAGRSPTKRI